MWNALRTRPGGFKFRRQHPAGYYILDFYCAAMRLAIEVDGWAHDTGGVARRDEARGDSRLALALRTGLRQTRRLTTGRSPMQYAVWIALAVVLIAVLPALLKRNGGKDGGGHGGPVAGGGDGDGSSDCDGGGDGGGGD